MLNIVFKNGWIDSSGNKLIILNIDNKNISLFESNNSKLWSLCFGIGSKVLSKALPAGRADYIISEDLTSSDSQLINDFLEKNKNNLDFIENGKNVAWSPDTDLEKSNLIRLVGIFENINKILLGYNLLYDVNDRYIYGKDITVDNLKKTLFKNNLTKRVLPKEYIEEQSSKNFPASSDNVDKFITALAPEFFKEFGTILRVTSKFRTPTQQAIAMGKYTIANGDFDKLYRTSLGDKFEEVKSLIESRRYEEAGAIIATTPMAQKSHMAGKAFDVGFNSNPNIKGKYKEFSDLINKVSLETGIRAKPNFEKSTHFHVDVA